MDKESIIVPDQSNPKPVPPIQPISKIQIWARTIQICEGWRSYDRNMINNNPGNLKWSSYTKTLGPTGKDKGNFCIFPDYQTGFKALCQFLISACSNELIPYKNATVEEFTNTYAEPLKNNPPNITYLPNICKALGVTKETLIKTLL